MIRHPFRSSLPLIALAVTDAQIAQTQEARWIRVDRKPDVAVYVDRLRARPVDSTLVEVWTSWEFTDTQTLVDKKFKRMVSLFRLDCRRTLSMQIEANFYVGDEFVIRVPTPEPLLEWSTAPPQSINETLVVRGCLIARGKPTEPVR